MRFIVLLIGISLVAFIAFAVLHMAVAGEYEVSEKFDAFTGCAMYVSLFCFLALVIVLWTASFMQKL